MKPTMPTLKTRAYIYRCLTAGAPIAATYGAMTNTQALLWLALAGTVLGTGLAAANTPANPAGEDGAGVVVNALLVAVLVLAILWFFGVHPRIDA